MPDQYYCHRCGVSFDLNPSDPIACIHCHGEFIEIVNRPAVVAAAMPSGFAMLNQFADLFRNNLDEGLNRQQAQQAYQAQVDAGGAQPAGQANAAEGSRPPASLEDWISNMFRVEQRGTGENGQPNVTFSFQMPGVGFQIHAHRAGQPGMDPEDERFELEQAMSEILATFQQIDGAGGAGGLAGASQRGFPADDVSKYLPMKKVSQEQVDNGAQCTTCFDTFKVNDDVGALDCNHVFHRPCIEPWLATKNSCPVCRHKVCMKTWKKNYQKKTQEAVLEDLD